ncbi:kinesin family protein [Sporothrix schenckii 1099-18]|nr:kinesin family protein [Sporothrix schenckii 1099-18]KJR89824.1 kinesin family protein [Sporothrix schenckii 1099-18]
MRSMSVVARWRPLEDMESARGELTRTTTSVDKDGLALSSVAISDPTNAGPKIPSWTSPHAFRHIFVPDDDNQCVYDAVVAPTLPRVLEGGRGSFFAYGHSGSGKTHTIIGYDGKTEAGVCLMAAEKLFEAIAARNNDTGTGTSGERLGIGFRLFEMRKRSAFDLLNHHKECHVRQGADGKVHIRGETEMLADGKVRVCPIVQRVCWSFDELHHGLTEALAGRAVGSSSVHDQSSRTHAILELEIVCASLVAARQAVIERQSELVPVGKRATDIMIEEQGKGILRLPGGGWTRNPDYTVNQARIDAAEAEKNEYEARVAAAEEHADAILTDDGAAPCLGGKMVFVDLAGAEYHHDKTTAGSKQPIVRQTPQERQEGQQINTDLLALKEVMCAWSADQPRIPFRSSTLTMVLREHFVASEDSDSTMIVTVSPSSGQYAATLNSLKYGSLVGAVTP